MAVHLIDALSRFPHLEIDVVTTSRNCTSPEASLWQSVRVHRLPAEGRWTLTSALGHVGRQVADFVKVLSPEVVHAHDTYGLMVQNLPVPRVLTIHGFIHNDTAVSGQRFAGLRSRIWRHFETTCWGRYPHIISISPYVRERLRGLTSAGIHDVENPISYEFFQRDRREQPNVIFSAAVISRRKNTLALVETLARLRGRGFEAELRLAGEVKEPAYAGLVRERVAELELEDRVTFLGPIKSAQVAEELERATIFALVSREENAPVGIQEAMAVGVPVIASNRCGMPYQVRDGETGFLVNPEDPGEIADRCAELLTDEELRLAASERAQQLALDRFHPDAVARRTMDVYRCAAGVRRRIKSRPRIVHF